MKVVCFLLAFGVAFIYKADCAITAWTTPPGITGADGNAALDTDLGEDTVAGPAGYTIVATPDSGTVTYALTSQTPTTGGTFTIATDGVLSFTGTLDFETDPKYELIIEATDAGDAKGTATVTLSIADVEEAPAFGATSYAFCITDLAAVGTELTTLTATDPEGTTVTYAIAAAGNTNTDFAVSASGVITAAKALDKSRTAGYALTLEATDTASSTVTTDVFVYVGTCGGSGAAALVSGAIITTMTVLVARFL